jgi:hypothetical protein
MLNAINILFFQKLYLFVSLLSFIFNINLGKIDFSVELTWATSFRVQEKLIKLTFTKSDP